MANLEKHIGDLLYDYDCVVIPQLGGFVTNYRPARLDRQSGVAHPPCKEIRFNRNLSKNDGLLAQSFSDNEGWSFAEANEFIYQQVNGYMASLKRGERVKFNRIGVLYMDGHLNMRFEPSNDHNFLKSSFGFESFSLPPKSIPAAVPAREEANLRELSIQPEEPISSIEVTHNSASDHSRGIYWVAAATLLPFIGLSLYIGLATNFESPAGITLADILPVSVPHISETVYTARGENISANAIDYSAIGFPKHTVFPFSFEENEVDSLGVWVNLDEKKTAPILPISVEGPYHLIGGCFSSERNANRWVVELRNKGYNASILDEFKNLHRVRIRSFRDYGTALEAMNAARTDGTFPNAWLLKKPLP